ncbi:Lipopolysaccharide export system protein LptC, partial [Haemophilus influenzae]
FNIRFTFATH